METVFGRRLYLPEINASNAQPRQYAERSAINAPMQGTAADIIKRAMIDVQAGWTGTEAGGRMIMQVHDELVFEVAEDAVDVFEAQSCAKLCAQLRSCRCHCRSTWAAGINWDEAH